MNHKSILFTVLLLAALVLGSSNVTAQEGEPTGSQEPNAALSVGFTYQGLLTDGGVPASGAYDFRFRLYDAPNGGLQVGATLSKGDIQVKEGYFSVVLNFGATAFFGQARWLEVAVRPGSSTGTYTVLSPRQALTATPYAIYSMKGPFWRLKGNAGTTAGTDFLGTTDDEPLELHVNGQRVFRFDSSNNITGGSACNIASGGGSTIGGGGDCEDINEVYSWMGTIAGGEDNRVDGSYGFIGGGDANEVPGYIGTVAGGLGNSASLDYATVGGGWGNNASGVSSTVPGGEWNVASGAHSFAAGQSAQAVHDGSFVWNDGVDGTFASWDPNRFQVHATNGAYFESTTPDYGDGLMVQNYGNGDGIHTNTNSNLGTYYGALYAWNSGSDPGVVAGTYGTYAGIFWNPIYINGGCVGCTLVQVGKNAGEEALEAGDLVAIRGLGDPMKGTDQPVLLVQKAGTGGTDTVIGVVQGKAVIVKSVRDEDVKEGAEKAEGPAAPGEYLFIVVQGITNTRVDASSGPIAVGQRLAAASNPGYARLLQTTSVNDVTVVEGAPVIGIALAPLDSGTGLIPVMVTLR